VGRSVGGVGGVAGIGCGGGGVCLGVGHKMVGSVAATRRWWWWDPDELGCGERVFGGIRPLFEG
jgi:hypothetical protein